MNIDIRIIVLCMAMQLYMVSRKDYDADKDFIGVFIMTLNAIAVTLFMCVAKIGIGDKFDWGIDAFIIAYIAFSYINATIMVSKFIIQNNENKKVGNRSV